MTLVQYAVYQATGIVLPGNGTQPKGVGTFIAPQATIAEDTADLLPGDAVFWGGRASTASPTRGSMPATGTSGMPSASVSRSSCTPCPIWHRSTATTAPCGSGAREQPGTTRGPRDPVVGMASTPNGGGYWLTDSSGGVSAHGAAVNYGSMAGHPLNAPVTHIVSTPDGGGYWLVAADGGIFSFGDAPFYGSMGVGTSMPLWWTSRPRPTAVATGWWPRTEGSSRSETHTFYGSMGGRHLNAADRGHQRRRRHRGLLGGRLRRWDLRLRGPVPRKHREYPPQPPRQRDGFARRRTGILVRRLRRGDLLRGTCAPFHGSMGGAPLNAPVVGMAADPSTGGYWLVASDGGVFSFDAPFYGAG